MTLLHLVVKRYWFDELDAGRKTVEYRDASQYWLARIVKHPRPTQVMFHRGYSDHVLRFDITRITITETQIEIHLGHKY